MRIEDLTSDNIEQTHVEAQRATWGRLEPSLWAPVYFAAWLCLALAGSVVAFARHGWPSMALPLGIWLLVLTLWAVFGFFTRIGIHDLWVSLNIRDKFAFVALMELMMFTTVLVEGPRWMPDGLLWSSALLLPFLVRESLARLWIAQVLLAGWFTAMLAPGALGLQLTMAWGLAYIFLLASYHFARVGDPYQLRGNWPLRRVLRNTAVIGLPALGMGWLLHWLIPGHENAPGELRRMREAMLGRLEENAAANRPLIEEIEPYQLWELIARLAAGILVVAFTIVLLVYLRRMLKKFRKTQLMPGLMAGQVAELERELRAETVQRSALDGLRGEIVRLWGEWEASMAREGLVRLEGETAREFTQRLSRQSPGAQPPGEMTELFEKAHYDQWVPSTQDVTRMAELVEDEDLRKNLRT